MGYDETKADQVLELTGDIPGGSRTLVLALAGGLFAAALAVTAAEVTGMSLGDAYDAEVTARIVDERQRCERMTRALAHVLNGGDLEVEGSTHVSCKAKQLEAS